ncbi:MULTISPECIES: hypothetical protein [unclassified Streptomyces]|uniref:hypothetical protein n=1 Tax=unclassified Streptomyces TaxID=2593676 RepID=UPI000C069E2F|nr:hypothetical protein [Streptomyces sp. AmelKG-D3]MYU02183.1 hypothetical protein [Streptomyces sp. SID8350]
MAGSLALLSVGCSSSAHDTPAAPTASAPPHSVSAGIPDAATPHSGSTTSASTTALPSDVERTARSFTVAYAEHDARDGADSSYADAGARAAWLASGELAGVLAQKRPGQDATWAALRAEKAHQTAKVKSATVPDGAPAATDSSALVRVSYVLTTTPKSGHARSSSEQLALRLEHTSKGWRVTALPWA